MFGSAGGLLEFRAAQLASRGFVTLALPFFDYEDLPSDFNELNVEYFEEAVNVLLKRDEVCIVINYFIIQVSVFICPTDTIMNGGEYV